MSNFEKVRIFQETFKAHVGTEVSLPDEQERSLRKKLLAEEYQEYLDGETNNDLVEIADALGDMLYIIYGTAVSYGLPIDIIFDEIHNSNMSKLDENGQPIFREDGKVLKSENYFKPNIEKILQEHKNV